MLEEEELDKQDTEELMRNLGCTNKPCQPGNHSTDDPEDVIPLEKLEAAEHVGSAISSSQFSGNDTQYDCKAYQDEIADSWGPSGDEDMVDEEIDRSDVQFSYEKLHFRSRRGKKLQLVVTD